MDTSEERQSDERLLALARSGDDDAFAQLCERHRRRVWRTVCSVAKRSVDAEDLAQDALVKAFLSLPSYRGDAPFGAWLCRIALNAAHDYQKSAWKRRVLFWRGDRPDEPDDAPLPECAAERNELQRRVRAAVASLGTRERVPIYLIYFESFSLAEVARLEGEPESTIRSRVKAGLKRLQGSLCDLSPDAETHWKECPGA